MVRKVAKKTIGTKPMANFDHRKELMETGDLRTIQNEVQREISERVVYRDCSHSPEQLQRINAAITGQSEPAGRGLVPRADAAGGLKFRGDDGMSGRAHLEPIRRTCYPMTHDFRGARSLKFGEDRTRNNHAAE